jgi:TetR/AcrR family transcriptional regulator, acrAB operon repressor
MARKTKEDTALTHAALLNAAEQVFFDKGVTKTTLADIAAAAGMTRGAIYWHFEDKGALLKAMFERAVLPMETMLSELSACTACDPLEVLRHFCVHSLTTLAESPRQQRVFGILFHKCENVGEVAEVLQHELECCDAYQQQLKTLLQQAVTQQKLPADTDLFMSMQVIHNCMVGTMSEWLLDPTTYPLAHTAPAMVDMLLAGLRACPPRLPKPPAA